MYQTPSILTGGTGTMQRCKLSKAEPCLHLQCGPRLVVCHHQQPGWDGRGRMRVLESGGSAGAHTSGSCSEAVWDTVRSGDGSRLLLAGGCAQ